jgi:hypothetical protein
VTAQLYGNQRHPSTLLPRSCTSYLTKWSNEPSHSQLPFRYVVLSSLMVTHSLLTAEQPRPYHRRRRGVTHHTHAYRSFCICSGSRRRLTSRFPRYRERSAYLPCTVDSNAPTADSWAPNTRSARTILLLLPDASSVYNKTANATI